MISRQIEVFGVVQGVFFRASTKAQADKLGLNGWVKNQPDGSVLVRVSGETDQVNQLIEWCWKGPMLARVDRVEVSEITERFDSGFSITA